ncbi:uncharacterized protein LOC101845764 isoform X2 [Aplysia californica]|uniref:Uncharacterized protein LOC101845764 isoform X2 n=1 Tax=Aplysia californica TaxID=6500 RepID=A0ABM0JJ00_APLCA|nr:uncharacterized protein LOC101845764 isoform X2 [Aplysia californica]
MSGTNVRTGVLGQGRGGSHPGQQLHVSGVFIIVLEVALVVENLMPVLVVILWLPARAKGVSDRLVAALSVTCILSALIPTPLGLASYFAGGWYGGAATCTTYQVTSSWVNLSSLALLSYMCVNCHCAVRKLVRFKRTDQLQQRQRPVFLPNRSATAAENQVAHSHHCQVKKVTTDSAGNTQSQMITSNQGQKQNHGIEQMRSIQNSEYDENCQIPANDVVLTESPSVMFAGRDGTSGCSHGLYDEHLHSRSVELYEPESEREIATKPRLQFRTDSDRAINVNDYNSSHVHDNGENENAQISNNIPTHDRHTGQSSQMTDHASDSSKRNLHDSSLIMSHSCKHNFHGDRENNEDCVIFSSANRNTIHYPESPEGWFSCSVCRSRDYVSLALFFLYGITLAISTMPVAGFGPQILPSESMCRSWLVPSPPGLKERTYFIAYLAFVYLCVLAGCACGASVCFQVSRHLRKEKKRKSRLYHEEENVPDLVELSMLDDMKRHYSLTCVVLAGLMTWLPILLMLTLQKSGVQVSEATLMYSHIATSLPGLLNPLLYSLVLARYRSGYKAILDRCCCRKRRQKPHRLSDPNSATETTLASTHDGHTCMHGLTNPSFDRQPNDLADDDDEEDDEDYFPDDSELLGAKATESSGPKMNERTPLQASPSTGPSSCVKVVRPVSSAVRTLPSSRLTNCVHWSSPHESAYVCDNDTELLLVSGPVYVDEETGL